MRALNNTRTDAAIYWSAVSLIVCEKQSVRSAAEQLGVEADRLRRILRRRRRMRPLRPSDVLSRQMDLS
jgi:hypothetical protein